MRVDLVQRDDSDTLLQTAILKQLLAHQFVIDDHVVKSSTCGYFQCSRLVVVFRLEMNKRGDKAFDL